MTAFGIYHTTDQTLVKHGNNPLAFWQGCFSKTMVRVPSGLETDVWHSQLEMESHLSDTATEFGFGPTVQKPGRSLNQRKQGSARKTPGFSLTIHTETTVVSTATVCETTINPSNMIGQ